ncbi:hypothetical protein GCM10017687_37420 [Streptomyces echinatus]|uniref:NADH-quinone oxidoreductase subunit D-related protein n=1 Tax=Streptomyces echinatus TaxID=67293 RepID=UPI0031EA20CB
MELGATTIMVYVFSYREMILGLYALITAAMTHAYIRPGGLAQDLPPRRGGPDPRVGRR